MGEGKIGNRDVVLGSEGFEASCLGDLSRHGGAPVPVLLPL